MGENFQSKKYQLTINNPLDYGFTHEQIINILNLMNLKYYALTDEIGEQGTYHTHIYICANSPIRFSTLKRRFPVAHIETAYGTSFVNRQYLLKEGKFETKAETSVKGTFSEYGEIPSELEEKHPLMSAVMEAIEEGKTTANIIREHPNLAFKSNEIDGLRQTLLSEKYSLENRIIKCIYVCGPTNVGKTYKIYEDHGPENVYRMTNYNRIIFDGYKGQQVLVFEEFRSQIPIAEMLSFLDIYPLMLPARYNDKVACYTKIYIVSNISLSEQYRDIQHEQIESWNAFLRRINLIRIYRERFKYEEYPCEVGGFIPCL